MNIDNAYQYAQDYESTLVSVKTLGVDDLKLKEEILISFKVKSY